MIILHGDPCHSVVAFLVLLHDQEVSVECGMSAPSLGMPDNSQNIITESLSEVFVCTYCYVRHSWS